MSTQTNITKSSIGRKLIMALSGIFLVTFLLLHFAVNFVSIFSEAQYNAASEFMGTNLLIQFLLQPILIAGVILHFLLGMYLEVKNRSARQVKYAKYKGSANANWVSRNMIYSGLVVLAFLALHFVDFWFPELKFKYVEGMSDPDRYYRLLKHEFENPVRLGLYILSFVFLMLHLLHGFQSSFQSAGFNHNRYTPMIKKLGNLFAVVIPLGFVVIALYHHFTPH